MKNRIKVVALSDTHTYHADVTVPEGDLLLFAGDLTERGEPSKVVSFMEWFASLPHKYKVMIAGNHDLLFEREPETARAIMKAYPEIHYLEGELLELEVEGRKLKIYGEPNTPSFGYGWAFNVDSPRSKELWAAAPTDIDILLTHGPPRGLRDAVPRFGPNAEYRIEHVGSGSQRNFIRRSRVKHVVCGHIHEGHGVERYEGVAIHNVSIMDERYWPANPVSTFEI